MHGTANSNVKLQLSGRGRVLTSVFEFREKANDDLPFFSTIIVGDEIWVYSDDLETRQDNRRSRRAGGHHNQRRNGRSGMQLFFYVKGDKHLKWTPRMQKLSSKSVCLWSYNIRSNVDLSACLWCKIILMRIIIYYHRGVIILIFYLWNLLLIISYFTLKLSISLSHTKRWASAETSETSRSAYKSTELIKLSPDKRPSTLFNIT